MNILAQRAQTLQALGPIIQALPPNLAAQIPVQALRDIFNQMFSDFVWPQIVARQPFEDKWLQLERMYKIQRDPQRRRQTQEKETQTFKPKNSAKTELADTIIFDTVDRLKNLNYFIAWKERPVQFNRPRFIGTPLEDEFYNPTTRKIQSSNAILDWHFDMHQVREKHLKLAQHHYLYGLSFVYSDFVLEIDTDQTSQDFLLINRIGTSFEPVSIRKLWLNPQLPISEMDKQPCPFFFDLYPRVQILSNQYDSQINPFGFVNLDKLNAPQWLYGPEAKAFTDALPSEAKAIQTQMKPEFSGEALWTFFPFLTLPGTEVAKRYVVQCFANNLFSGGIIPLRIQELYTPKKRLPLYGCAHIPDLDSGLYTPSIADLLSSHYDELVRAKTQFLLNKDWINNPPTEVASGSPAANDQENINTPGKVIEVVGQNDITRRIPYDATQSTIQFIEQTRDSAQTSGKAVDAILGKAMGGRTTATEASNAFQASMSGVTTDIDQFALFIYGGYAERVWENTGKFIPKNIVDSVIGSINGPPITEQEFLIQIGIKADVGSSYIESIVKQQHLQQAIISSTTSPFLDQCILWKAYFRELKLPEALDAVKDNGYERQVEMAYQQAVDTYNGLPVNIDPGQDHQIAVNVKTRFLQDTASNYNKLYAANPSPVQGQTVTQYLAWQIQIHQQFILMQQQQQMMMMQAQIRDEQQQRIGEQQHQLQMKSTRPPQPGQGQTATSPQQPQQPGPQQGSQ